VRFLGFFAGSAPAPAPAPAADGREFADTFAVLAPMPMPMFKFIFMPTFMFMPPILIPIAEGWQ
jgi:hypothetical protein